MRSEMVFDGSLGDLPAMLTVEEAARVLRIGRSLAYQLATRYLDSGGTDGLPVLRLGGVLRVPDSVTGVSVTREGETSRFAERSLRTDRRRA